MRALISVSDKSGIDKLARSLSDREIEIVSTGGTAAAIVESGISVTAVSEVTGMAEMLDGRVKTLHPAIHGGLLARLERPDHRLQLEKAGITPITILISNLYPFEHTATQPRMTPEEIVENIDIGGPAMVRAAAKNYDHVYVVTDPTDYSALTEIMDANPSEQQAFRKRLAAKAFAHVSTYDSLVAAWLRGGDPEFPEELTIPLRRANIPKYGENPHQRAAVYDRLTPGSSTTGLLDAERIHGQELSFNNYLDADAAWEAAQHFPDPAVAIVKHMVPCGLATRPSLAEAYKAALAGDPISAFGGVVAFNATVDPETASLMRKIKLDIVIAPDYDKAALESLKKKKGTRILRLSNMAFDHKDNTSIDIRPIAGGMLAQTPDDLPDEPSTWNVVTQVTPTEQQADDLAFAWQAARLVKSNAIVIAKERAIIGVGAGQPNRLESVAIAVRKAGEKAFGAAMASDAFFPFTDGIQTAIDAGVSTVIQPGGSMRDEEVIAAADAADIAMIFTGRRHFRH